jgi:D-3-phosphoglycerate dehydrogenase / 2-oxoglutarate reductase
VIDKDSFLINTSRGGIVNENDLYYAIKNNQIASAAIDAFEQEPYQGPLIELENIILTQHMGSCSYDCRSKMEIQATEDILRFFNNQPLLNEVPEEEYFYQEES